MGVETAIGRKQAPPKSLCHQLVARHGPGIGADQQLENAQLGGRQLQILLADLRAPRSQIEPQRTPLHGAVRGVSFG